MDLPIITIQPSLPHTHTVVFLHGRGDSAKTFSMSQSWSTDSQNRSLQVIFPSFRWIFPQAPLRKCASVGDTMRQWFDVWSVKDFSDHEDLQAIGLKESVASIRHLIASEAEILNGRSDRVILAGISQGGATSVHTLLNLNLPPMEGQEKDLRRLGAFVGFSVRMPFPGRSLSDTRKVLALDDVPDTDEIIRNTPILLEHCVDDPLVLIEHGRGLRDNLQSFGANVTWKEYPDGGHWFNSPAGMDDVVEFLKNNVLKNTKGFGDGAGHSVVPEAMD